MANGLTKKINKQTTNGHRRDPAATYDIKQKYYSEQQKYYYYNIIQSCRAKRAQSLSINLNFIIKPIALNPSPCD